MNILEVKSLNKIYKSSAFSLTRETTHALKDVSLSLDEGKILGIVGESGSGKSTLAKIISSIEKPTSGQIIYKEKDLQHMSVKERKKYYKEVQIVFQDSSSSLNGVKTIDWLLEEPLIIHNLYSSKRERKRAIVEILESVELDASFLKRYPHELSGGQRQRINLALSLIVEPELIIADEAVSALDVSVQAKILTLIKRLMEQMKLSMIFISHDLDITYYMSDKIAVMKDGKLIEWGSADQIFYHPKEEYTKMLFHKKVLK